jgi:hypothetical protein
VIHFSVVPIIVRGDDVTQPSVTIVMSATFQTEGERIRARNTLAEMRWELHPNYNTILVTEGRAEVSLMVQQVAETEKAGAEPFDLYKARVDVLFRKAVDLVAAANAKCSTALVHVSKT